MTSKVLLKIELKKDGYYGSFCVLPAIPAPIMKGMRRAIITFATKVQEQLGLPNNEKFLLWHGLAEEHRGKYYLLITVSRYERNRKWIPKETRNVFWKVAVVGEEIHRILFDELPNVTELISHDEAVKLIVDQLK